MQAELQFGDDEYQKSLAKLNSEYDLSMEKFRDYEEGRAAVAKYYSAHKLLIERKHKEELDKIQKEQAEKIQEHVRNAADI